MMKADPRCGGVLQGVGSKMLRYVEIFNFPKSESSFFGSSRFFFKEPKKRMDFYFWCFGMIQSDSMNLGMKRFKT